MATNLEKTMARMLTSLEQKVDPKHAAVLVVDVQNDFCADGGMMYKEGFDISLIQAMVPRLVNFLDKARSVGLTIILIQHIANSENNWYLSDAWLEQHKRAGKGRYVTYPVLLKGSWNADFYGGVRPLPREIVVNKHRYSAFADTNLDLILRSKGIRTLIMTGVTTNACVETTSRDGFMKDYYIVFVKDCTATISQELHNNTLKNIAYLFGEVVGSEDIIKCWEKRKGVEGSD